MKDVLFIILGWLLGLLSQPIASRIEKYYRREDLKNAIFSEMRNIIVKLATVSYKIQMHLGIRNKLTLEWLRKIYEKYRPDCPKDVLEAIAKLLKTPDAEFNTLTELSKARENVSLGLKKYSLHFTESILSDLSVFDSKFQSDIFEILSQIYILNEEIENGNFYNRLTFDPSCMNVNKDIIRNNLFDCYRNIQERCQIIVNKIEDILRK